MVKKVKGKKGSSLFRCSQISAHKLEYQIALKIFATVVVSILLRLGSFSVAHLTSGF